MIQSAKVRQHDLQSKITKVRTQLAAMRDYKRLMAIDGIVRLLYLEKQLNGPKPLRNRQGPNKPKQSRPPQKKTRFKP
jgi:hypothetical protein